MRRRWRHTELFGEVDDRPPRSLRSVAGKDRQPAQQRLRELWVSQGVRERVLGRVAAGAGGDQQALHRAILSMARRANHLLDLSWR